MAKKVLIISSSPCLLYTSSTPRGHMHAIEDITASLRTGAPVNPTDCLLYTSCLTSQSFTRIRSFVNGLIRINCVHPQYARNNSDTHQLQSFI